MSEKSATSPAAPAPASAPAAQKSDKTDKAAKPVKPDDAVFAKNLATAEKELGAIKAELTAVREKIDLATPDKNKDTPAQKRRQELLAELQEIRQKQQGFKSARNGRAQEVKRLDEKMHDLMNQQKKERAKVPYKSVEELDARVRELEAGVESGKMKIVEEKKALNDISMARKYRKTFSQVNTTQEAIDDCKRQIKDLKDKAEDPEQKALSDRYTKLQEELNGIKAQQDEAFKNLNGLRDERTRLYNEEKAKIAAMRKLKDDYYSQKRAFSQWEWENREKARERQRAEKERIIKERKKADAQRYLDEAANPAFLEEMRRATSLLQFLDPSTKQAEKAPLLASSGLMAQPQRKVDGSDLKGVRVIRKEDRDDEYLPAVKKGKKGKKHGAHAESSSAKFNCPPSVVEDCSYLGLDPPMSQEEVPAVVEKVKEKLAHWKENQEAETKKNIEKAKKELERLEKEEANPPSPKATSPAPRGKKFSSKDKKPSPKDGIDTNKEVDEATAKMEETSVNDTKAE